MKEDSKLTGSNIESKSGTHVESKANLGESKTYLTNKDSQDVVHDSIASAVGNIQHQKSANDNIEKYKHKPGDMTIPYYSVASAHHQELPANTSNSELYKPIKQYIPPNKRKPDIPKPPI